MGSLICVVVALLIISLLIGGAIYSDYSRKKRLAVASSSPPDPNLDKDGKPKDVITAKPAKPEKPVRKWTIGKIVIGIVVIFGLCLITSCIHSCAPNLYSLVHQEQVSKPEIHHIRVFANNPADPDGWTKLPVTNTVGLWFDVSDNDECFVKRVINDQQGKEKMVDPEPFSTKTPQPPKSSDAIYFKAIKTASGNLSDGVDVRWWNQ